MKEAIYYNSEMNIINLIYVDKSGFRRVFSQGWDYYVFSTQDVLQILVEDGYELIGYV